MRSKTLLLLLISVLIITGCSKWRSDKFTCWVNYNDEEFALFSQLVEEYQTSTEQELKIERIPFAGTEQKILTALATNTIPDFARVDVAFLVPLAKKGAISSLDTFPEIERVKEELVLAGIQSAIIDEKLFCIPDQVTCVALFYNRKLFEEVGLPDRTPSNWDEFIQFGKKLTNPETGIYGFGMRNTLWWTLPIIYTYGSDFLIDGKCALTDKNTLEAIKLKTAFYTDEKIEAGAWRSGSVDPDMGFQSDKYAMVLNGPWKIRTLVDTGIDFGVGLIPEGPSGTATNIGGTQMVVFKKSKHQKQAVEFLNWLTSAEIQTRWANELGQLPVNTLSLEQVDTVNHPYLKTFAKQLKTAHPRPPVMNYGDIENAVNPEMELVLSGKKTPEEAMADACLKMEKVLTESEE